MHGIESEITQKMVKKRLKKKIEQTALIRHSAQADKSTGQCLLTYYQTFYPFSYSLLFSLPDTSFFLTYGPSLMHYLMVLHSPPDPPEILIMIMFIVSLFLSVTKPGLYLFKVVPTLS